MVEFSDYSSEKTTLTDLDYAFVYMKILKYILAEDPKKIQEFVEFVQDIKHQRIDSVHRVRERVWELFEDHKELILGFNAFLPKGSELTVDKHPSIVDFEVAIAFINKVKLRFIDREEHTYKSFLGVLIMYRNEHKSISEVEKEIVDLLGDQNDLIEEFLLNFLPRNDSSPKLNYEKMVPLFHVLSLHSQEQVTAVNTKDDQIKKGR